MSSPIIENQKPHEDQPPDRGHRRSRKNKQTSFQNAATSTPLDEEQVTVMSRRRQWAIRILAVVSLFTASLFPVFVIGDALGRVGQDQVLEPAGSPEAQYGADHPAETIHIPAAIALEAIVVLGLAALVFRPGHSALASQAGAVGIAMLLGAGIAGDPDNYGGQGLPIDPALVVLALPVLATAITAAPWRTWGGRLSRTKNVMVLAALATPALWYGVGQALLQRNTWPPLADPHHQAHWIIMAELASVIPLATAGAAISGRGWRPTTTVIALAGIVMAVASLAGPDAASALSWPWAIAVALWATALLVETLISSRCGT